MALTIEYNHKSELLQAIYRCEITGRIVSVIESDKDGANVVTFDPSRSHYRSALPTPRTPEAIKVWEHHVWLALRSAYDDTLELTSSVSSCIQWAKGLNESLSLELSESELGQLVSVLKAFDLSGRSSAQDGFVLYSTVSNKVNNVSSGVNPILGLTLTS